MTTKDLEILIPKFLSRLEKDGHSREVITTNIWITQQFQKHCTLRKIEIITMNIIEEFLKSQYDIDLYKPICASQIAIRRPLLIFWEYSLTGTYQKSHLYEKTEVPRIFNEFYLQYCSYINSLAFKVSTKSAKVRFAKQFLAFLDKNGVTNVKELTKVHVYHYLESYTNSTYTTKQTIVYDTRGMLDWMYEQKYITFSGHETFPMVRISQKRFIPSCYTDEEIRHILDSVDVETTIGKHDYLILSLLIYYGMRISDIIALKFENIDWNGNTIKIIQQKTGKPLMLPLIDEIKFPLIDYLKNARHPVDDDHILVTLCAPYTCYARNQSFQSIVVKYMDKAGVDYSNKHHGTHAIRHSLASGLLNENVPISAISGILGHGSIETTNIYLTLDEKDFQKMSLEVPDVHNS